MLSRHPGLDPGSTSLEAGDKERWIPDQVRHDEKWRKALVAWLAADAAIAAASHSEDEALYDHLGDRHDTALKRLLRAPAPDVAALAAKLDLLFDHVAWELTGAERCLATIREDAHRLAAC